MKEYKINRRQNICICISVSQKLHLHNTVVPLWRGGEHGGAEWESSSPHMEPHNAPVTELINHNSTGQRKVLISFTVVLFIWLDVWRRSAGQSAARNISTTIWWFPWSFGQIFGSKTINQLTVGIPDLNSVAWIDIFPQGCPNIREDSGQETFPWAPPPCPGSPKVLKHLLLLKVCSVL